LIQGRIMIIAATGFTLGVILFQQLPWLPQAGWLLLFPLVLWLPRRSSAAWFCTALLVGFFWSLAHALWYQPEEIPQSMSSEQLIAEGTVLGLPEAVAHRTRFYFQVDRLDDGRHQLSGNWKLRLSWYRDAPGLLPGERWRLPLRLKPVRGYWNAGGFDYEGWLYSRGVRYTGYVKSSGAEKLAATTGSVQGLRLRLVKFIGDAGLSDAAAGVLRALVVGDRAGLSQAQKRLFSLTGTSHLVAISGLHIGLVAGLVYLLFGFLWRHHPRLCSRWPAAVAAITPALLAALVYAALAGFSIPTRRALIMLALVYLAIQLRRQYSRPQILALALMLVLLLDPLAVISAGFWLSFGAVAAILWMMTVTRRYSWFLLQFGIALALAPLLVWLDLPVSPAGPLVNMLAIPLFALSIVPLALAGALLGLLFPPGGRVLLQLAGWLLDWFLQGLYRVVDWMPEVSLVSLNTGWLLLLMAGAGVSSLLLWRKFPRWRLPSVMPGVLALVILLQSVPPPEPGRFRFTLLDVGQGLSAVIRTARHVLVFDTGPSFPSGFNTGDAVLLPWLRYQGVSRIDLLLLSHSDMDHVGGAAALLQGLPVSEVLAGEPVSLKDVHPGRCRAGRLWWWDGVRFEILYPPPESGLKGNDASCVLRVSSRGQSVLLTGDIEKAGEHWLVAHAGDRLPSDLVVAAHHGSSSSSSREFVQAVRAKQVLYSAGKRNRWGFPRPEVVARWRDTGAGEANTADQGSLESLLGGAEEESVPALPARRKRYWQR
jgi:competence protein ComEC